MAALENGSAFNDNESLTYAEAFPPLGAGHTSSGKTSNATSSMIKPIPASTLTKIFHVPLEERRYKSNEASAFGSESQASAIRDIMTKTGCNIETSQSKDLSLTIIVSGKPSSVKEAEKMICTDLLTKYTAAISIPKQHHRVVLGKQGAKLHQIEEATNTKITIPRGEESSDVIRITGNKEGVEMAQHQIQTLSDELAKKAKEVLDIPHDYHPFISGAKNESVNKLMQDTGTRIHVPPYSVQKSDITITGEKEGVAKAKACILKLYDEAKRNYSTVSVEVRKSQHKYIIGMKGQGVQEILHNTGVMVDVPSSQSSESTITLRGPQDKLGEALSLVYSKANSMTTVEVEAPSWLHRFIIGQNGQNIKDITQDLPHVMVTFPKDTDKIVIEGPPDEVQCAKESFERFTAKLKATMVFAEVHVDQKFHPHVIGKRGANVQKIKKDTCTSISIPGDTQNSDVIRIEGDPKGVAAAKKAILELAAKLENESTKSLQIDQKWHKLIIGANGENMKALHDRYPKVHVAFPEPGRRSNIVTLRGPKDKVEECSTYLSKLAKDISESNYKVEVKIFKKYHGSVIGKGGSTLKKIREETNTKIDMPKEDMESDVIVITGRREDAELAKKKLQEIERQMASIVDLTIKIPHKQHNAIIGPRGKLIRSVMEDCGGVHIKFPPNDDATNDTVVIHGPKEDATRAKEKLLKIAADHAVENYSIEIKCKPEYHRFLIGKGGGKIRKIRDEFDARVLFPQKESGDDVNIITVIGRKENVDKTKAHLEQLIHDLTNVVEEEISVNPKHHRYFIQRRGQLIQEIAEENGGVMISFPRSGSGSDHVVLKGAAQCVAGAKAAIQEIVDDLDSQVTIECVIPQKHHRDVMGPRGTNVQTITQEHNVSIKFPDRETKKTTSPTSDIPVNGVDGSQHEGKADTPPSSPSPKDIILIMGRADNCEAASKALLDLVPVKVLVNVPYEFHRFIIGASGQEVRKMAEKYSIVIEVPHLSSQEDIITLIGPAHNCEEGKQALELKVQELEAKKEERELRSFKEVIEVDPKYHPNIIGRRGATINKIRKDHDVRIQLPEKDAVNASEIAIIGYEHNVHAAMEALLKIVRELEDQISEDIEIDHRVHSRLIGGKGRAIAKVMEKFNVVIRFPHDKRGNTVTITGLEENVEDAKEHLIMLAEEYMQDVIERQEEEDLLNQYTRRPAHHGTAESTSSNNGFVVKGAPWSSGSNEEFPTIGSAAVPSKMPSWGPSSGPKIPKGI